MQGSVSPNPITSAESQIEAVFIYYGLPSFYLAGETGGVDGKSAHVFGGDPWPVNGVYAFTDAVAPYSRRGRRSGRSSGLQLGCINQSTPARVNP